ncbi:MAG: glycosyltransferase family 2 protein [Actinomycetes bacterium]
MSTPQEPHANPYISVVVAAYNEEDTIGAVLDALGELDLDMEVIVVNDGSTDRTAAIIESRTGPRLHLISKPNGGKGTALRAGFEAASGSIIVIQDADVELSPARIPDLIAPIIADSADVVFGSRFLEPVPGLGWERRLANWFLTMLSNISFHTKLTDMETAHKAIRGTYVQQFTLEATRFDVEVELTAKLSRLGARIIEIPSPYTPRTVAEGKKIGFGDGIHAVQAILHWRRWRPQT